MSNTIERRRAVVIMGMHRSGTSALASAYRACGVNFGTCLIRAEADMNELAFNEHADVVPIHATLLEGLSSG